MSADTGLFLPLDEATRALLAALVAEPFPGRAEIVRQIVVAEARPVDDDGCLALRAPGTPSAPVLFRVPVEGAMPDVDGVGIHVLLHVVDGFIDELEVFREDHQPPKSPIDPARLTLVTLPAT